MIELSIPEAIQRLRRYDTTHYNPPTRVAHRMAIHALEEKIRQPLTLWDLRTMGGKMVYCLELNTEVKISAPAVGYIRASYAIPGECGTCRADKLTLFLHRPEGVA